MNRSPLVGASCLAFLVACSCSGGGSGSVPILPTGEFIVLRTEPVEGGIAYLNDPIRIDFTSPVDLDSASFDTVNFQVLDQLGNPLSESVSGRFALAQAAGDGESGRQLLFVPHLPTRNSFDDGGLRGGRNYIVNLVGGIGRNGTTLRNRAGRALEAPVNFRFATVTGTSPAQLFRNPRTGGPRRLPVAGLAVAPATDLDHVSLNLLGGPPLEVRLHFDQALNPHDTNVPVHLDTNPLVRRIEDRGRIWLEYDDPVLGNATWLPAEVELERNDLDGSTVVLRPVGVLPNNAAIRVIVENTVEDISGESNAADLAYDRVFGTFHTERAYTQQFTALVEDFDDADNIDFDAVFAEPVAEVGRGYVKAGFAFEGNPTTFEYEPTAIETVLSTSFTQIVPRAGLPFNVAGGVFQFRSVHIPQGVIVRGQGPNPMVWLCTGDFRVDGELTVRGGNGARVDTLNSANYAKAAGIGGCGGGNGGAGSPSGIQRDARGGTGNGPLQVPLRGGAGGRLDCLAGCYSGNGGGSGGGGGTLATQGDPNYRAPATTGTVFQQRRGIGGTGCSGGAGSRSAVLAGGEAAPLVFVDARADNDFWGAGLDFAGNLRITGELAVPQGGGGGGGGGDRSNNGVCTNDASFANDNSGGGGGGGGGVLIVKALGEIVVGSSGRIVADGGHGGGGEQVGSCGQGGGGAGGAGGMIVLMSSKRIVLHAHGTASRWNYAQSDYDFVLSADGGVTLTGSYGGPQVAGKYPASGQPMMTGDVYDSNPLGGLGGMGIVQLMAPPGDNAQDGTNTRLDDNIDVFRNGVPQTGTAKQQILAWRGFQNAAGVFVDDAGVPTDIGQNEGDIRPAPILLPAPFGAQSRVRSKWLDTGASQRRPLAAEDDLPRGLVLGPGTAAGPVYEFAGLQTSGAAAGYLAYEPVGQTAVRITAPLVVPPADVLGAVAQAQHLGSPAYAIDLAGQALGPIADRYRDFEAELLDAAGTVVGSFRIASHSGDRVLLAPGGQALPEPIARLQVRAKFFAIETNGSQGLGPVHVPTGTTVPVPRANVRLGFAFHRDPAAGPAGRYPLAPQDFVHDLGDAGLQGWIQQNGAPRYVQWDVTFHTAFSVVPSLGPDSPRPELHFLRLPFRF